MDAIGLVASVVAVIELSTKALASVRRVDSSSASIERIEKALQTLALLKDNNAYLEDPELTSLVLHTLTTLSAQLDTVARKPSRSKLEQLWRRRRDGETVEMIRNLDDITSTLQNKILFRLSNNLQDSRKSLKHAEESTRQIREDLETFKSGQNSSSSNRENLLQLLDAGKSYDSRQRELLRVRFENTGDWVLSTEEFVSWAGGRKSDSQVLWIKGPPGSGKSVLMSTVIEWALSKVSKRDKEAVVYFYFEANGKTTTQQALSSLLGQLLQNDIQLSSSISTFLESYRRSRAGAGSSGSFSFNLNEATSIFLTLLREFKTVTICVDGLDECSNPNDLFQLLFTILESSCRLVVASRPWPMFEEFLHGQQTIDMTDRNSTDIRQYFRTFLRDNPRLTDMMGGKFSSEVERFLERGADGSFMWTGLQMEQLLQLTCRAEVNEYLERAPSGLEETYRLLLSRIKEQHPSRVDLASRILTWLTTPKRLLTLSELRQALSINENCGDSFSPFDPDRIPPVWVMEEVCMGLVTIDEGRDIIKLSHHSLVDFFSHSMRLEDLPEIHKKDHVALCCIACMRLSELTLGPCDTAEAYQRRISETPFAVYVAEAWGDHIKKSHMPNTRMMQILSVLQDTRCSDALVQLMLIGRRRDDSQDINQFPKNFTALHMAAYFGLDFALDDQPLSLHLGLEIDNQDSWGRTALHTAAQRGHEPFCDLLLSKGANTAIKDTNDESPLHHAVSNGHLNIVNTLLKQEAPAVSKDEGRKLLETAAQRGHFDVIDLLLGQENVEATAETVHIAAAEGYFEIAELLIDHGGHEGVDRAMLEAARQGAVGAALQLFELGADVNVTEDEGKMAALHHAAVRDQALFVVKLISLGADPEARDAKNRTPLFIGAEHGHKRVVEELLDRGAVMEALDTKGRSPLDISSAGGHTDIVQTLCSHGCKLHTSSAATNPDGMVSPGEAELDALQIASFRGFEEIVGILLAYGADPNQQGRTTRSPLSYAAEAGRRDVVRRLLDMPNVHVNALDSNGRTPLSYAAEHGHYRVVSMLLAREDIDSSLLDNLECSALSYAKAGAHHETAFLLDLSKADVSDTKMDLDYDDNDTYG